MPATPLPDRSFTNTGPFAIIPDAGGILRMETGGAIFSSEGRRSLEQALRVDPNPHSVGYSSKYSYGERVVGSEPFTGRCR